MYIVIFAVDFINLIKQLKNIVKPKAGIKSGLKLVWLELFIFIQNNVQLWK